jgi:Spy/CpxP family protein refolding chaperone
MSTLSKAGRTGALIAGAFLLIAAGLAAAAAWAGGAPAGPGSSHAACARGAMGGGFGFFGRGSRWGGGPLERLARMEDDLSLTPDQRDKVRGIIKDALPGMKPLLESQAEGRKALFDLIHADTVDETAIRKTSADLAASGGDLAVARAHVAEKIRAVLTPDQIRTLDDRRARMEKRRALRREFLREHAGEMIDTL